MPLVHAISRRKKTIHEIGGVNYVFEPNAKGDVVAEVDNEQALVRFISVPESFRLYEVAEPDESLSAVLTQIAEQVPPVVDPALEQVPPKADESPYVLVDAESGASLDLRPMDDAALHTFAAANNIKVHPKAKGDTIRDKIVEALKSEG